MKGPVTRRAWWIGAAAAIAVLIVAVPLLITLLDAGYFQPPLIHYFEAHFNRQIRIEGRLRLELFSPRPRLIAEQVIVSNPSWAPPGEMGRAGRLTLTFSAPGFGRPPTLQSVTLEDATLHLVRDDQGRANWHRVESATAHGKGIPLIQELSAEGVHLTLDDARRHLKFDGIVSAEGHPQMPPQRLKITGKGELNGKAMSFELDADPLDSVRAGHAFAWQFAEDSAVSHVRVHGSLPQPYLFDLVDAAFEASGENLNDLYFLTGVGLINTGAYHLTGSVERRGDDSRFADLHFHSGQSEVEGSLAIGLRDGRPQLNAELSAKLLRTADFGAQAAGRAAATDASPRIFSTAAFNPESVRRSDTKLRFTAQHVEAGRTVLESLDAQVKIERGVITANPVTADLLQGRLEASVHIDANQDVPAVQAQLRFKDLQLSALHHKGAEAPAEGLIQVRVDVAGKGRSIRQMAATANGNVAVSLPQGTIRASLAELAGVDLRGLGLTLAHSKRDVAVRCAAAEFKATDGTLSVRSLIIDTMPVVVTGSGDVHLDTEALDLTLRGQPKDVRLLRLDAPLLIQGTLARPSIAVQTRDSKVQLVDPGHGKDVDCAQLLSAARSDR